MTDFTISPISPGIAPPSSGEDSLKTFKRELYSLDIFRKSPEEIGIALSAIIPPEADLSDILNILIDNKYSYQLKDHLAGFLCAYPTFTLSPHHEVCRIILEDKDQLLTNEALSALFREKRLSEEQIATCFDLAYRMNHPHIYPLPSTPVSTDQYTLNFLWINLNPQDRVADIAAHIFGDGRNLDENAEIPGEGTFIHRLTKWVDAQPGAQINLWYDSALVTEKARQSTFKVIKRLSRSKGADLALRDIRHLPNIEGEIKHALHPGTPLYFRVDLLKVLIADFFIDPTKDHSRYCVVSDIDIKPMPQHQLFDERTIRYLDSAGYVFNRVGLSNFENNFFIFNKTKEGLYETHREIMINRIALTLTEFRSYPIGTRFHDDSILGSQAIYSLYYDFRETMEESHLDGPRKVVQCPSSQFNGAAYFSKEDHREETFRFIGDNNVPYTLNGRNYPAHDASDERPIESLNGWRIEPLPPLLG